MELQGILSELVDFVKSTAPQLWAVMVRQSVIAGILQIVGAVFCCGVVIVGLWMIFCKIQNWCYEFDWDAEGMTAAVTAIVVCAFIACCLLFPLGILHIGNPEYYAIRELIGLVK